MTSDPGALFSIPRGKWAFFSFSLSLFVNLDIPYKIYLSHQVTIGNKKDDFLNIMSHDPEAILILLLI